MLVKKMIKTKKSSVKKEEIKVKPFKKDKSKNNLLIMAVIGVVIICAFVLYFNKAPSKDIAAIVNGESITIQDINEQYDRVPEEYKQFITKEMLLNQSINELLLLQEAKKQGISITKEELSKVIDDAITQSGLSKEDFDKTLEEQNLTMDFVEDYYKTQMVINNLLNKTVISKIIVSSSEAKEYYNNNKNEFITPEQIRARHILVNSSSEAEKILKELKEGADFIELAKEKSTCPSASQGGDLGYFARSQMIKEFEDAAFALNVGEISPVVETQFGYHIIKLLDKKPETLINLEDAMQDIEEKLKLEKQNTSFIDYLNMLRDKSDIRIFKERGIEEKETFPKSEISPITISEVDDDCITKYGLKKDTVIFVYSDSCPHCNNMKPLVTELEDAGYNFYWATGSDSNAYEMLNECFADIMTGYIPQFICPDGVEHTGEMPIEDLKNFADKCRA
ncbi:MAG: peptidylprolyl isomerase [Nanoarchaeota archaeon]|nr:peptidylprolyl isomerase [Nanoarchaeota archaeon]